MPLYIVGNGAHATDICSAFVRDGVGPILLDDDPARSARWPDDPAEFVVGVNDPRIRRRIAERLIDDGWKAHDLGAWVHRTAYLNFVTYGKHTHINGMVFAVRCKIGDYCTIAPGVTICGDVTIGDEVFIGAGATICNLVTIGDGAKIGAGAVVLRDVPAGATVVGVPGREVIR